MKYLKYKKYYRNDKAARIARKDLEDDYGNIIYSPEKIVEKLMKYNNTHLQYLLRLYYHKNYQGIYFIYKSADKAYKSTEAFLYKTLWTDIKEFFIEFNADFISSFNWFLKRNPENINNASKFCDDYFKWLSKNLAEKEKGSFEEVKKELMSTLN
jgi:hypothetical protein